MVLDLLYTDREYLYSMQICQTEICCTSMCWYKYEFGVARRKPVSHRFYSTRVPGNTVVCIPVLTYIYVSVYDICDTIPVGVIFAWEFGSRELD